MKKKGYTLVELILAIAILALISMYFMTSISYGYKNIVEMENRTVSMYSEQQNIENIIEQKKKINPTNPKKDFTIFGKAISAHEIKFITNNKNEIYAYIPKETINYTVPVLSSNPIIKINNIGTNTQYNPQPLYVDVLDFNWEMFVAEVAVTNATKPDFLMNVYRWYMTDETDYGATPGNEMKNYFAIKEWNEAKKQLQYSESDNLAFIPNIKDNYNRLSSYELKTNLNLTDEDLIDRFGNRYIRYGITPYSIAGRIGEEKISNLIYITKPLIVESATYNMDKTIEITFNQEVKDPDKSKIKLNSVFGAINTAVVDVSDKKKLIINLKNKPSNINLPIGDNSLDKGAVTSILFGKISIYNGENGKFQITN
ncbi:prepilin-type N-terminal cleavage/methylation domain-containing protein [Soehngenia saccharolytica]|nr:prepilin-type N-terminal cleavage/methylation domain-containing protein [Soehngenia saccharolytica]